MSAVGDRGLRLADPGDEGVVGGQGVEVALEQKGDPVAGGVGVGEGGVDERAQRILHDGGVQAGLGGEVVEDE